MWRICASITLVGAAFGKRHEAYEMMSRDMVHDIQRHGAWLA